jgi:hypothetical protein
MRTAVTETTNYLPRDWWNRVNKQPMGTAVPWDQRRQPPLISAAPTDCPSKHRNDKQTLLIQNSYFLIRGQTRPWSHSVHT